MVVSAFALGFGLFVAIVTYRVMYGSLPECAGAAFAGLGGSLQCDGRNPSFAPYAVGGIAVAALIGIRWWRRFLASLDA